MSFSLSNARYVTADQSLYDVAVTQDGETFDYTVSADDPAPMAAAIRAQMAAENIAIGPYVAPAQSPRSKYAAALAAGLAVVWSASTSLNATFACDQTAQFNFMAETVEINTTGTCTNGQASRNWPTLAGGFVSLTAAQIKALSIAVAAYIDGLIGAMQTESAGGTPSWPTATVTVTG